MIVLDQIHIEQGEFRLQNIELNIARGAYAVLMGGTGSGKTTVLEVICGLRLPIRGRVLIDGRDVTRATPSARDVGYVPQDGALFKTMTVADQLGLALYIRKEKTAEIKKRVDELGRLLGITHLLNRMPAGLSGGERQRVALARALSFNPRILLLDEPLAALDEPTRITIMALLKQVHSQTGVTVLHVTHNQTETEALATDVLRLADGMIGREMCNA